MNIQSPSIFTIGGTHELRRVLEYLHEKYPKAPLLGAGFSMGANILINYVGEYHNKNVDDKNKGKSQSFDQNRKYIPLLAAVSVSQSYDLLTSASWIPKHRPFYSWGLKGKVADVVKR